MSAHKLPDIALVTLDQCSGLRDILLDDDWEVYKLLGLLERVKFLPLIPDDTLLNGLIVGVGGGGTDRVLLD